MSALVETFCKLIGDEVNVPYRIASQIGAPAMLSPPTNTVKLKPYLKPIANVTTGSR
jgi:hypothetical protein